MIKNFVASAAAQVHSLEGNTLLAHRPAPLHLEHINASFARSDPSSASIASVGMSNASVGHSNASFGVGPDFGFSSDVSLQPQDDEMTASSRAEGTIPAVDTRKDVNSPTRSTAPAGFPLSMASHRSSIPTHSHVAVGTGMGPSGTVSIGHNANSHSLSIASGALSGASVGSGRGVRTAQAHSIVICGPAGIGKSTLIQMHQANWRKRGLWGHAKMIKGEASPFTGLVSRFIVALDLAEIYPHYQLTCLSSVLRQLMMFQSDRHMFVSLLRTRLGPQLQNVPLLYHGVPELRDLLATFGINLVEPQVLLSTEELGARFQSLVECVYATLADVKLLALVCLIVFTISAN